MWRPEHDPGAASAGSSASNQADPEIPAHRATPSAFQHPLHNPTPFSTFPAAWVIGAAAPPEGPSLPSGPSANPPGSIGHAPSDLLPNGLLTTPTPSTPATQLLKVLVNNRITIAVQDASNNSINGPVTDSPATSGGPALRPLDSLVLPSPSLLPGGVHSLPTPTSSSSQPPKPIDSYGSRGSPLETASSKDSIPAPNAEQGSPAKGPNQAPRLTAGASSNRRADAASNQHSSRNGNGSGSSGSGVSASARTVDSSSSAGTSAAQFTGSRHPQPTTGAHHGGYGAAGFPHGHSMQHPPGTGLQMSQQPQAPLAPPAAATGGVQQQPNSPTIGYSALSYYMAQMPPGSVVMGMHHPGGTNAGNGNGSGTRGRATGGGNSVPGGSREGSAGSSWRASRSGSGAHTGGGNGQGGKHMHPYGAPQQLMQGPMAQDGSAGPYGMTHIPYTVYGMMAPGIVMPQVLPPVGGSPGTMEAHGPLAHQPVHMGPMIMQHGPPIAMGVGIGHHMHSFPPHGHIGGQHMGMHAHSHMTAHAHAGGFSHPHGHHYHGGPGMGPGYSQLTLSHSAGQPMHGPPYASGRGANSRAMGGNGASQPPGKVNRAGGGSGGGNIVSGAGEANGGMAAGNGLGHGNTGSARDSPVAARGRTGGREKAEAKSRTTEQRERKPGNSRAPAIIAQCVADMAALETQLQDLVQHLTPGEDELAAYQAALTAVRELVEGRWPQVKVHLFGSAANGLSIAGSNEIDITIEAPDVAWDDHPGKATMVSELGDLASGVSAVATTAEAVGTKSEGTLASQSSANAISSEATSATPIIEGGDRAGEAVAVYAAEAEFLRTPGAKANTEAAAKVNACSEDRSAPVMTAVSALPKARTPIVKMTVAATQTRVDLTINNLLAICNTAMVRDYCTIDPRLRQLALVVKHWARTRSVNDSYRGSLSSYAYVLLCIWLMQQRQPTILPVLQQREPHTYDKTVGPWRCSYNDRIEEVKDFGASNKETLAQLLVAFFDHWAWRHDYNGSVVCVRTGGTVPKAAKEWTKRQGNERHLMCIEDPFELSHDLGRTIDKAAVQVLRREFERAARIFASNPDPMSELLAPLTPEEEAAVTAALQSRRKASKDKERAKERQASAAAAAAAATPEGVSDGITDTSTAAADVVPAVDGADTAAATGDPGAGRSSDDQDSEGEDWSGNGQANHAGHEATDANAVITVSYAEAGGASQGGDT